MQHNEPYAKKDGIRITDSIKQQADVVFKQLMAMNDVSTLLWELRTLRLMILTENRGEHIDADFIRSALEQAGLGERPVPAENVYLLQNVCYALADKWES